MAIQSLQKTRQRYTAEDRGAYLRLIKKFPIRPIRSEAELDEATEVIDELQGRKAPLTPLEEDYLEVLSDQIERFEDERYPMPPVSDVDMLRHLMEANGMTQREVAEATGIVNSTISAILAGKRALSRNHIEKLARYFNIGPGAFLPE